jgi:beta-galactosidase
MIRYLFFILFTITVVNAYTQNNIREDILLNNHWRTIADDKNSNAYNGFESPTFKDEAWTLVEVPHNWDDYGGYRAEKHGNRHGYAWYRKSFSVNSINKGNRFFLWFEGVGSYATVWLNGHEVGQHAGGRTTFTLDVTKYILLNQPNLLAVRADHPAGIRDLPWVCGGCSQEQGFSEGSQPMGIFRPVHLIITSPVRVEPFGVHVWNNNDISEQSAVLHLETEVKNYDSKPCKITLSTKLIDKEGRTIAEMKQQNEIAQGQTITFKQESPAIINPHLWTLDNPYLYSVVTEISIGRKVIDRISTPFGIRWISWSKENQFLLNGKLVFINGIAEYEHLLGQSHAFSEEQIRTRVKQVLATGFNAFRDAHQPHNLRYQEYWDKSGLLWWPQFAAHIWFDSPSFRNNFKNLLRDWVKERRNSPSIILWGLENESTLPQSFAEECSAIIRELDPTASSQRKITTCNGGKGTDWDVPQNWTGTYGGDPSKYAEDIQKQRLIGEYGAWRSIDCHTEATSDQNSSSSEDRMVQLMEMKIRLADSVSKKCYGQFFWLLSSHDNPARVQNGEGFRNIDRIGPVNYKGLLTSWGEPTDAFYMYRSNFVAKEKEPMVYIVSHTWPDRWTTSGIKNGITVYSNCDEVELFNDIQSLSLGTRKRNGIGTHFQWDSVNIVYNILYAEGKIKGKVVTTDIIVLNHLPCSPHFNVLIPDKDTITKPVSAYHYLYRINCGGPEYKDINGNIWMADVSGKDTNTWSSHSWSENYPNLPSCFASRRRTSDLIKGTRDGALFQTFRFGRHKLSYEFPVSDGEYLVELYFTEPWYGAGGGMDCTGWRLFDVAVNDSIVLKNLDIWKEAGHDQILKKVVKANVKGGRLTIAFPNVLSGQAMIAAIAIATSNSNINPAPAPQSIIKNLIVHKKDVVWSIQSWLDTGAKQYSDNECTFSSIPKELYGDEWIRTVNKNDKSNDTTAIANFSLIDSADVYIALDNRITTKPAWLDNWTLTNLLIESDHAGGTRFNLYKKHYTAGAKVLLYGSAENTKTDMYTIIIHKPTILEQPAPSVRPAITYEAENAILKGPTFGNTLPGFSGKGYTTFNGSVSDTIDWSITVGVGDTYGLRFKYINSTNRDIVADVAVIADDGSILSKGSVYFSPSTKEWDKVIKMTETSINAGHYRIRLVVSKAEGLSIDNLKVL